MLCVSLDQLEEGGFIRRRVTLAAEAICIAVIDFDLIGAGNTPRPKVLDCALMAVLPLAMSTGQPLRVKGPISRRTLHDLAEFQTIMVSLHPRRCRPIEIYADEVVDDLSCAIANTGISLFSGGVDSTFTLLRHQADAGGVGVLPVKDVVFLHHMGLDNEHVARRLDRFAPLLDGLQVEISVQKTNLAKVLHALGVKYILTYGAQLSASLQQYSHAFNVGLLGSSSPTRSPIIPDDLNGSLPATDWLFSTPQMQIFHDGSGFSRSEKIELIARHPVARQTLHVCLKHPFENCGICRKCVRTYLNFAVCGIDRPECMPGALDLSLLDEMELDPYELQELKLIIDMAAAKDVRGPWRDRVERRLRAGGKRPFVVAARMEVRRRFKQRVKKVKPMTRRLAKRTKRVVRRIKKRTAKRLSWYRI